MEQVQYSQSQEETTEGVYDPADPEGYEVPEHEEHLFHVELELVDHDRQGRRLSKPYMQKFTEAEFKQAKKVGLFEGYAVKILSAPEGATVEEGQLKREPITSAEAGLLSDDEATAVTTITTATTSRASAIKEASEKGEQTALTADSINATPKQKLQTEYEKLYGEKPAEGMTMVMLQDAIDDKKKPADSKPETGTATITGGNPESGAKP